VLLSPLHASTPVHPLPPSPYSPSSRRWHNPLLLRVDELAGAAGDPVVAREAAAARALLAEPIVDRDRCWPHQRAALEHLWAQLPDRERDRLAAWRADQGDALEGWARFCALAEEHGPRWPDWPAELHHPTSTAVAAAAEAHADRVAFHAWLQLLVRDQLGAAAVPGVRLIQDLAVGADPAGADAWLHQDLLALDVSIGAPPDDFAPDGQVWSLPPFIPWRLRDAGYRPLAELLRAAMTADGGLRVDHVMGLTRLFWVPIDAPASAGGYVRFAGRELLEVLAIESQRAGALVVGEDLGTVEDWLRHELAETAVLTTRVVWFEDVPPAQYPPASLGVVTTHDLPTVAGVWTGADEAELAELGRPAPPEHLSELERRFHLLVELPDDRPASDAVEVAHQRLAAGASALVLGTLEDLCGVAHRPNVPGTTTERHNWSQALPVLVDDLPTHPDAARAVAALTTSRPAGGRED
jgi:4-alpha-glucanotransferase